MPLDVEARVIQNTRLSPDYNVITLAAPEIAAATKPGQFVMVRPSHGPIRFCADRFRSSRSRPVTGSKGSHSSANASA